jgi:hypothetical protein
MEAPSPSPPSRVNRPTPNVSRLLMIVFVTVVVAASLGALFVGPAGGPQHRLSSAIQSGIGALERDLNAVSPDRPLTDEEIVSNAIRLIRGIRPLQETASVVVDEDGISILAKAERLNWTFEVQRDEDRIRIRRLRGMDLENARRRKALRLQSSPP